MQQSGCFPHGVRLARLVPDTPDALRTAEADGLWAVPGTPYRNDAAVYTAIKTARTSGQPFLGTCGGFQYAVVEFARNVAGIAGAEHGETAPGADQRVVDRLACSLVGQEQSVTAIAGTQCMIFVAPHRSSASTGATMGSRQRMPIDSRSTAFGVAHGLTTLVLRRLNCPITRSSWRRCSSHRSARSPAGRCIESFRRSPPPSETIERARPAPLKGFSRFSSSQFLRLIGGWQSGMCGLSGRIRRVG